MLPSEILKLKLPEIKALMARPDISEKFENLRVFGSVADGTDTEQSDIDFMISCKHSLGYMPEIHLQMELEEILGLKIDLVDEKGLNFFVKRSIASIIEI